MFDKSSQSSAAEPSFYHLMLAATYFRRAARSRHPNEGRALRDIGREYLAKAGRAVPARERSRSALDTKTTQARRHLPGAELAEQLQLTG
jgi:hypothetical protein